MFVFPNLASRSSRIIENAENCYLFDVTVNYFFFFFLHSLSKFLRPKMEYYHHIVSVENKPGAEHLLKIGEISYACHNGY